jgi:antitoxin HicB
LPLEYPLGGKNLFNLLPRVETMAEVLKVPLVLTAQPEGGFTVTSPVLPELITEGDTLEEAIDHVRDALEAVIEIYEDLKKPLPSNLRQDPLSAPNWFEGVISRP